MKKLLSLLSVLMVGGSSTLTVVACSNNSGSSTNPDTDVNANVKTWSQQSSNIAKSIILGKTDDLNTNNILENGLKNNINNITNAGTTDTGADYTSFTKAWGYNGSIEGINEKDFNSNTANTTDNNATKIAKTANTIKGVLPLVLQLLQGKLKDSKTFSNFILAKDPKNPDNFQYAELLGGLLQGNNKSFDISILKYIPTIGSVLTEVLNELGGFNPQDVLGQYYPGADASPQQIQDALFKKQIDSNPAGWIANYYPNGNDNKDTSDSISKNSDILKEDNQKLFQNWDQVALFKTSADLNYAIKTITKNSGAKNILDLSSLFQDSIIFKSEKPEFNPQTFVKDLTDIYNAIYGNGKPETLFFNIVSLLPSLIQIIKYNILGLNPTQAFTEISTTKATNKETGIINIKDIMNNINKILLTKEGFINFFTNIFFPPQGETKNDLFLSLDITYTTSDKKSFAIEQIIKTYPSLEGQIITALTDAYDNYLQPLIKKYYIREIFNKVSSDLESLIPGFDIKIEDLKPIVAMLQTDLTSSFFTTLSKVTTTTELKNNWVNLWNIAGLPKDKSSNEFVPDSLLSDLHNLLYTTSGEPKDLTNVTNFLTTLSKSIADGSNTLLDKINETTSKELDFNNKKLWLIEASSINFQYDKESNQSTISYNLTYKGKTYQVSVVINTNAHDAISTSQKVWLKSLVELN